MANSRGFQPGNKIGVRFKPGVVQNPTGRPKILAEIQGLFRKNTEIACQTLVEIATNKKLAPAARVAAASAILDRGWGKPMQAHELTTGSGVLLQVITGILRAPDEPLELEAESPVVSEPDGSVH